MNEFSAKPKKGTIELGMCNPNPYRFSVPYSIEQGDEFKSDSNLFRTYGATHALSIGLTALAQYFYYVNKKPTLYLYAPFYLDYINIIHASGWCYDVQIVTDLLKIKIDPTSVLLINFPNNPTGRDVTDWEINFLTSFSKVGFVIYDCVYNGMMKPSKVIKLSRGMVIDSLSKRFTWCGMRYGYLLLNPSNGEGFNSFLREKLIMIIRSTTVCPLPKKTYHTLRMKLREQRISKWYIRQYNKMKKVLDKYSLTPSYETGYSPFFLLHGSEELFKFFEGHNVNVLRGDSFGVSKTYYRITTAVDNKTIKRFDKVLGEFYNK